MALRVVLCICVVVWSAVVAFAQGTVQLGSLTYVVPDGWTANGTSDSQRLTNVSSAWRGAWIELYPDRRMRDGLDAFAQRQWETWREGRAVLSSEDSKQDLEGIQALVRVNVYSPDDVEMGFIFEVGGMAIPLRARMVSESQIEGLSGVLEIVLGSLALADGTTTTTDTATTTAPTTFEGAAATLPPSVRLLDSSAFPVLAPIPTGASLDLSNPEQAAARLAWDYANEPARRLEILALAIRASGFNIRRADRSLVAAALTPEPSNVYFLDTDVSMHVAVSQASMLFDLGVFVEALQVGAYQNEGLTSELPGYDIADSIEAAFASGGASEDPGQRFYVAFLNQAFQLTGGNGSLMDSDTWSNGVIDPGLLFVIMHPYLQSLGQLTFSVMEAAARLDEPSYVASLTPGVIALAQVNVGGVPVQGGTIEDTGTFVGNTIFDKTNEWAVEKAAGVALDTWGKGGIPTKVLDGIMKSLEKFKRFAGTTAYINAVSSLMKFITTYACLDVKWDVVGGEPLVRTQDTRAGETKLVRATLTMNSSKVQDVMKTIRPYLAPLGVDLDQPPSGPVSGAKVNWTMLGSEQQPVYYAGTSKMGIRGGTTDPNGGAEINVVGRPQKRDLKPDKPAPFLRKVPIGFTYAPKAPDMAGDINDAVITATPFIMPILKAPVVEQGTAGGALPILGPIMETLYRVDWAYKGFTLDVKDWNFARAALDLNISLSGTHYTGGEKLYVDRTLGFRKESDIGARFQDTGNNPPGVSGGPDGMKYRELKSVDGPISLDLKIADRWERTKKVPAGCMSDEMVDILVSRGISGPRGADVPETNGITLIIGELGEDWRAWIKVESLPAILSEFYDWGKQSEEKMEDWSRDQMPENLRTLGPLRLEGGVLRSYEGGANGMPFGVGYFGGSLTLATRIHGVTFPMIIHWSLMIAEIGGETGELPVRRWAALRQFNATAFSAARRNQEWVAQAQNTLFGEKEREIWDAASCTPTKARVVTDGL